MADTRRALDEHHADAIIEIRPTINTPRHRNPLQFSMLLLRYYLANLTAVDRNPMFDQPYRELFDYGIINPSRAFGVSTAYLASSDRYDILDRLRAEGCGYAGLGFLAASAKVLVASIPSALVGLGLGVLFNHFSETINSNPVLRIILNPPLWRVFTAIISPLIFAGTSRIVNYCYPPPNYNFNQRPALHPIQKIMALGLRIYDAVIIYELFHIFYKAYAPNASMHHPFFPAGVALVDQVLANMVDRLAFGRHTFDGPFPFHNEQPITHDEPVPLLPIQDVEQELIEPVVMVESPKSTVADYALNRGNVAHMTIPQGSCDNVKVMLWHGTRMTLALGAGFLLNYLLSMAVPDKEILTDSQRMAYNSAICTATVLTERLFEVGVPWAARHIANGVSSCWSSLFGRGEAVEPVAEPAPQYDY